MGRPPIGNKAMTAAERQRKRRAMLANEAATEWKPEYIYRPTTVVDQHHNEFMDRLLGFLEYGDVDQVTEFLADALNARSTDEPALPPLITKRMEEMEREAIADERRREREAQAFLNADGDWQDGLKAIEEMRALGKLPSDVP